MYTIKYLLENRGYCNFAKKRNGFITRNVEKKASSNRW